MDVRETTVPVEQTEAESPFKKMRLATESGQNCDCDGGCDDGNIDNY